MRKTIALIFLFITQFIMSQQIDLDTIKLEGRIFPSEMMRVDENYQIITQKQIAQTPVQSLDELLSMYSGVDVTRRGIMGVQSDISVRGGTFEQVLVLINGVRMTDAQTAHNQMSIPLDLNDVERVEIIKGSAARRYGANAFAGVINIITKISSQSKVKLNAMGASYGTFGTGVSADISKSKLRHKVHANYTQSDGYRFNTDFNKKNLWYQNSLDTKTGKFQFQAGFGEKKFGANGFYASPQAIDQYETLQSSLMSATYEHFGNKFNWKSLVFWKRSQDMYLFRRYDPDFYRNMHIGNNVGAELSANYTSHWGVSGIGVEYRSENLVSSNLGKQKRNIASAFVEHNFNFLDDKLNITPGISWSHIGEQGDFFFPGLELGYEITKQHKMYAHVAKVHRVPSFTELYYQSRTEQGNPELKPESAVMYEVGYRFRESMSLAKLSLFYRDADDLIDWVKDFEEDLWMPNNVGNVKTKGVEVNLTQKFDGFFKRLSVDYTYLDQELGESATFSRYAFSGLRHQLVTKVENNLTQKLSSQLSYRFLDRVTLDNYTLLDAKMSYTQPSWNAFFQINNVLDTDYQEANLVPMPGRWFSVGASYTIGF